ncbi:MAG: DNA translocase FtsK [Clostridia bacterium]|nr:DNA translocase FtsK [Clostridia bacterium]
MAAKKRGRPRGSSTATKIANERRTAENNAKRQVLSIVWFAVAVFLMAVIIVPGENAWNGLHNIIFGIFGVTAYFYPVLLGFVAIMFALNKFYGSIYAKVVESGILVMLVGAAVDIFTKHNEALTFWEHLKGAYVSGVSIKSGGFFGALLGQPLYLLFGRTGAVITIILLLFVILMLITGTTLIAFFKAMAKPVKHIEDHAGDAFARFAEAKSESVRKQRSPVDISVDDIPEKRENDNLTLSEKQRKVVDAYNGKDTAEQPKIADALAETAKEAQKVPELTEAEKLAVEQEIETAQAKNTMVLADDDTYKFPPLSLLKPPVFENSAATGADLDSTASHLVETLRSFGVETRIVDISRGPTVTRYELQPCAGVKISKITNLADDIALNLATAGVRIEAPIPNKAAVGIEVPNKQSNGVGVREILESPLFTGSKSKLTVALGRDIGGKAVVTDIAKMPHGLIAGATGSGKSVCINSIIMSILYKATPEEVKLLMIDPKVVELGIYNGIPHLLVPVVTDPRKASGALSWAVTEMEKRYAMFAETGVRDLTGYNKFAEENEDTPKMPHIVIIIDELADLMMTAPGEVEDSINRIAAKARAAGMHLLIATQRPSVDVVTGVIKANIPTRIAFAVSSQVDSRTILDVAGAEKLLGRGDMLFNPMGASKASRLQGCFVSDDEVEAVVNFIKGDHSSDYDENVMHEIERQAAIDKKQKTGLSDDALDDDPMLSAAIETVVEIGQASTSLLQRKLKLGYARAARLIDVMEERGVVGPYEGSKPRQVLITKEQLLEKQAGEES